MNGTKSLNWCPANRYVCPRRIRRLVLHAPFLRRPFNCLNLALTSVHKAFVGDNNVCEDLHTEDGLNRMPLMRLPAAAPLQPALRP